jgi:hypothetical protein
MVQVSSPPKKGLKSLFSYLACGQIWLELPLWLHHKIDEKTLFQTPSSPSIGFKINYWFI